MNRPMRLAIVLSHPTQYYSPWFRWLRTHTALDFRVFYLWEFGVVTQRDPQFGNAFKWDVDLLSGYDHEFVPNTASRPGTDHFGGLQNPLLTPRLEAWQPTAVLFFGYKWRSPLQAIAWARRRRLRLLFRGDSHFIGRQPSLVSRILLGALYRQFDAFLAVGQANRDYFRAFGVAECRLFSAPHSVNHELFDPADARHRANAAALRSTLGLAPSSRVVLFAGKLVPAKQPRELLEAFLALQRPDAALVFVGDGSEKSWLQERARAASSAAVHFLPFANQTEMPARFLLADIFALPSRGHFETWGLAVNEAMHMGVPALVTDRVGCQRDLVTDGETGWVTDAGNVAALQATLARALDDVTTGESRERLRTSVTARISGYTYAQTSAGLRAALEIPSPSR